MPALFALDSNAIIHAFQGKGRVGETLISIPPSRIAIPAVVLFEVEKGVLRSRSSVKRRRQLDDLKHACRILPLDDLAASIAWYPGEPGKVWLTHHRPNGQPHRRHSIEDGGKQNPKIKPSPWTR